MPRRKIPGEHEHARRAVPKHTRTERELHKIREQLEGIMSALTDLQAEVSRTNALAQEIVANQGTNVPAADVAAATVSLKAANDAIDGALHPAP
jgi:hypothetical protein